MKTKFLLPLALALSLPAFAKDKDGVHMEDHLEVATKSLTLNGMGTREVSIFAVKVYIAGLYLETPTHDANQVINSNQLKVVTMQFVHEVPEKNIKETWTESISKSCGANCAPFQARIGQLVNAMQGVAVGDHFEFVFMPDGVEYKFNGQFKVRIAGADFGRMLLGMWFGANPPNAKLKSGMLGI